MKGAWLAGLMVAIPAFLLDLEAIVFVSSMGNILIYAFMCTCSLALRYRKREEDEDGDQQDQPSSPKERLVWSYFVLAFVLALGLVS